MTRRRVVICEESCAGTRCLTAVIVAELLIATAPIDRLVDHAGSAGTACMQVGHRTRADALVSVLRRLELDLAGGGADLRHVVHVSTPMLLLLPAGHLLGEESLVRRDIIKVVLVSTHERLATRSDAPRA